MIGPHGADAGGSPLRCSGPALKSSSGLAAAQVQGLPRRAAWPVGAMLRAAASTPAGAAVEARCAPAQPRPRRSAMHRFPPTRHARLAAAAGLAAVLAALALGPPAALVAPGCHGARVSATVPLPAGTTTLYEEIGGPGSAHATGGPFTFNGGGIAEHGGWGGGASDVRTCSLSDCPIA